MKANRLRWFLLFLLVGAAFQSPAQQSEADSKLLADIRAKAEKGDAQSQYELGQAFHYARLGVAKDDAEAVKWYRKAAEQNLARAQSCLGFLYSSGIGVAKNEVEAVKWYRKAAEQNDVVGQFGLGLSYEYGEGVGKDDVEAVKWFRKAAEQNLALAQYGLGICYAVGGGVAKDDAEATKWYRKAAEQNLELAQTALAGRYIGGRGVAKDYVEAYKWILLAAAQGNQKSMKSSTMMEELLTREQMAEGQKLARNFKPRAAPSAGSDSSAAGIMQTRPEFSGTGFFITDDGYLITNEHVAAEGAQVRLVTETGLISAKVVKVDVANDLALLKADGKFAALTVTSSRTVKMGSTVATVGFPNIGLQGFAPKLAKGEIASLSGAQDDPRYFQVSVPLQPGNSGGSLVDERGNVVGVVAAKLDVAAAVATSGALPENVNYAVKSSLLLSFLESVPEVSAKLKEPITIDRKFEDVVQSAQKAAVLVLVY